MNFDFDEDQQVIKSTAREFLTDRFRSATVRRLAEAGTYDDGLWREISELGWPGIFLDEAHGGQGLGIVELVILAEELGYALAPSPFLSSVAAGLVLQHAGTDAQRARWLPGIATGEVRGTVGVVRGAEAPLVPDAEEAQVIVLVEGGTGRVVEAAEAEVEHRDTIDSTRRFAAVRAPEGVGEPLAGDPAPGVDRLEVTLAAELVGLAQRAMEMAVAYAKDRRQFGRPIGSFQAVSHRCAQMLLETESARSQAYYAAWAADHEPASLPLAASMAKAYAADAGWRVTSSAIQVHGGIAFTWEHDLHFWMKRARTDGFLYASAREHRERVADLVDLDLDLDPAVGGGSPVTNPKMPLAG
jgi:alkylation response protein AidB-like acyl-CoA dehydrogenase